MLLRLNQSLTYWAPVSNDGFGTVTFGTLVELPCRWQDAQELFLSPDGRELVSSAVIYTAQPLAVRGMVALGGYFLEDPRSFAGDADVSRPREIRQVYASLGLRGGKFCKAWL